MNEKAGTMIVKEEINGIEGSSDASIRNVVPNDLSVILDEAAIRAIYVNGKTALKYYEKYTEPVTKRQAICLPSTSPAKPLGNENFYKGGFWSYPDETV